MVNLNVFSQILSLIDRELFKDLVAKHKSDKHCKGINSWTHLASMIFCHFSSADSVRDISNGLRSTTGNLNHLGVIRAPSKSNISYINKHRTHELFKDLYFALLDKLWQKDTHFRKDLTQLKRKVYLMDASVIPLCLSLFDWAKYTFVKAVASQKREDFIDCLNSCLQWSGGVPQAIVSDNLKSAVSKGSKYAPEINKTLADFALFHSCVVDPARPYHPQDKALVERSVTLVYQRIFYPLDKQTFFSLKELNVAIAEQLVLYNDYLFSHGGSTRRSQFIDMEKEHLTPLPLSTYNLRYFRRAKVQKISHIYLNADRNYYSVPHRYIGHHVEVQYNNDTVEVFYNFQRIAKHQRCFRPGNYATIADHMPSSHQVYNHWSPMYFEQRAEAVGPSAQQYIRQLIAQYSYPELGYKQAQGILALVKTHSVSRVENACKRGLFHHKSSYQTIVNILKNKLDTLEEEVQQTFHIPEHENLRDTSIYR